MAKREVKARPVVVDGQPAMLVDSHDYEVLISHRRQLGAYRSQIERLKAEVASLRQQLAEAGLASSPPQESASPPR